MKYLNKVVMNTRSCIKHMLILLLSALLVTIVLFYLVRMLAAYSWCIYTDSSSVYSIDNKYIVTIAVEACGVTQPNYYYVIIHPSTTKNTFNWADKIMKTLGLLHLRRKVILIIEHQAEIRAKWIDGTHLEIEYFISKENKIFVEKYRWGNIHISYKKHISNN